MVAYFRRKLGRITVKREATDPVTWKLWLHDMSGNMRLSFTVDWVLRRQGRLALHGLHGTRHVGSVGLNKNELDQVLFYWFGSASFLDIAEIPVKDAETDL